MNQAISSSDLSVRHQPQSSSDLRVFDVDNHLAGPYAATVTGEFAAEVIEVEHPGGVVRESAGASHNDFSVSHGHFSTNGGRLKRDDVLERWYATDASLAPLNDRPDIFGCRRPHARCNLVATDIGGQRIVPAPTPRLGETQGTIDTPGPKFGLNSSHVLRDPDEAQMAALRAKSVI